MLFIANFSYFCIVVKKNKYHIVLTWALLLCFVAGQYMVYSHNHADNTSTHKLVAYHHETQPKQTITENCQLCDAMHHNTMSIQTTAYVAPVVVNTYFYKAVTHDFISISLILSAGRSPPIA